MEISRIQELFHSPILGPAKQGHTISCTYCTVESCKFGVLGTRHFILKYQKFELLDCTLPVSTDFGLSFISELSSIYFYIVVLYAFNIFLQCCRGVGAAAPIICIMLELILNRDR